MSDQSKLRCHCNECGQPTLHDVLHTETRLVEDRADDYPVSWTDRYDLMKCRGCESVLLRESSTFDNTGEEKTRYFPPRISRRSPRWEYSLPYPARTLVTEICRALQADSSCLALMGARTLFDLLSVEKVGDVGGFVQKLDALERGKFIAAPQREVLEAVLDAGHAASHRGHVPHPSQLNAVMDIMENLLQAIYVLPSLAAALKQATPRRR